MNYGLVIFQEEIAFFMMTMKDRGRKLNEHEDEEEHSFLMV